MMKAAMLTFAANAILFVGAQAGDAKKDQAKLKGTWKIVRFETGKGDDDNLKDAMVIFDGAGMLEMRKGDESKKADYKLDPAAKPAQIDVSPADDANKIMKGIYELKKDTLKICIDANTDGGQRPTEFKAAADSSHIVVTLERAK